MYKPFDSMPPHSRIWIYQANREFTSTEKDMLEKRLTDLCTQWQAHGSPLQTSFTIQYDRFVIMAVDEQVHGASGCSIDGSVHFLQGLQKGLGLDFFDRSLVAFSDARGIFSYPFSDIKTLLANQTLLPETLTFNNTIITKGEWEKHWLVNVKESWMARYLPKTAVAP
jgi:hypothetical protein